MGKFPCCREMERMWAIATLLLLLLGSANCSLSDSQSAQPMVSQIISPKLVQNDVLSWQVTDLVSNSVFRFDYEVCALEDVSEPIFVEFPLLIPGSVDVLDTQFQCVDDVCTKKLADSLDQSDCISGSVALKYKIRRTHCFQDFYDNWRNNFLFSVYVSENKDNLLGSDSFPSSFSSVATSFGDTTVEINSCVSYYFTLCLLGPRSNLTTFLSFDSDDFEVKGKGCSRSLCSTTEWLDNSCTKVTYEICPKRWALATSDIETEGYAPCIYSINPTTTTIDIIAPVQCQNTQLVVSDVEKINNNVYLLTFTSLYEEDQKLLLGVDELRRSFTIRKRNGVFRKRLRVSDEVAAAGSLELYLEAMESKACALTSVVLP